MKAPVQVIRAKPYYASRFARQKAVTGICFSLPVLFGLVFFFALPLVQSLQMAFSDVTVKTGVGLQFKAAGWKNFLYAFQVDGNFTRSLVDAVVNMATTVPLILFLSFFCALLINQNFHGRGVARVIFFLPIIYASSAMMQVNAGDVMQQAMASASYKSIEASQSFLQSFQLADFIARFGLPAEFTAFLSSVVDKIYELITLSGVQILILLASLQSLSPSLYEAATVEGAGGFEKFWLITLPMSSSALLLCLIYSIIDSFVAYNNPIVTLTRRLMTDMKYGYSAAMSWVYFLVICIILGLVALIGSRKVFYYDK